MTSEGVLFCCSGAGRTHRGRVRGTNEDAYWFTAAVAGIDEDRARSLVPAPSSNWCVVVADGLGGHRSGCRASRELVQQFSTLHDTSSAGVLERIADADAVMRALGSANVTLAGMGATLAALACADGAICVVNVGDSRVYVVEDGYLAQLSRDDTAGYASGAPRRASHGVTQAIGTGARPVPHVAHVKPRPHMRFLLCSDGLWDMLDLEHIEAMVAEGGSAEAIVDRLVDAALEAGGTDNVTAVLVDVHAAVRPHAPVPKTRYP